MMTPPKCNFIKVFAETILKPRGMNYKLQFMGPTDTNAVETALKLAPQGHRTHRGDGLQPGLTQPVALLINEGKEIEEIVNKHGYLFFTTVDDLKKYVRKEILANQEVAIES